MVKKNEKKINIRSKKNKQKPVEKTTTPAVWNPFELFGNFDRFFIEDSWLPSWWRRRASLNPWSDRWLQTDTKISRLDLIDTGDAYKIKAEVPGVLKENLDINITENTISICGETNTQAEKENEGYIRRERSYSTICRNMSFPEEVNPDKAEAKLKDGVLEINVSKKKPSTFKGRKIPIK
jgi:HSP20 family protein